MNSVSKFWGHWILNLGSTIAWNKQARWKPSLVKGWRSCQVVWQWCILHDYKLYFIVFGLLTSVVCKSRAMGCTWSKNRNIHQVDICWVLVQTHTRYRALPTFRSNLMSRCSKDLPIQRRYTPQRFVILFEFEGKYLYNLQLVIIYYKLIIEICFNL